MLLSDYRILFKASTWNLIPDHWLSLDVWCVSVADASNSKSPLLSLPHHWLLALHSAAAVVNAIIIIINIDFYTELSILIDTISANLTTNHLIWLLLSSVSDNNKFVMELTINVWHQFNTEQHMKAPSNETIPSLSSFVSSCSPHVSCVEEKIQEKVLRVSRNKCASQL